MACEAKHLKDLGKSGAKLSAADNIEDAPLLPTAKGAPTATPASAGTKDYQYQYSLIPDAQPEYGGTPGFATMIVGAVLLVSTVTSPYVLAWALLTYGGWFWSKVGGALALWLVSRRVERLRRNHGTLSMPLVPWVDSKWRGPSLLEMTWQLAIRGQAGFERVLPTMLGVARACDFKTFSVSIPMYRVVSSHTAEFNKHLLDSHFYSYEKGSRFHDVFADSLGSGIFNSDGKIWKEQRNAAAHLFTSWQLENTMLDVFQRRAEQVVGMIGDTAGAAFDLQALMYCYTFDSIFEIAFGKAVNALGGVERDVEFQQAFDVMQARAAERFFEPETLWKFKRFIGLGSEAHMARAVATVRGYVQDVLASRREQGVSYGAADLIAMYEQQNEDADSGRDAKAKRYDDSDVVDFIINFTIAGRDTTASLMTSAFYMLSVSDPKHRARVEEEVRTAGSAKEMQYLQAVLQETLRMWPSVPTDIKTCVKVETLPCGTRVEPGEAMLYSHLLFGRNPANFDRPNTFDPERWMNDDGTVIPYDPKGLAYPAFNGGPRICLGRHMAMLEAKTLMATVMADYHVDVVPGFVPVHKFQIVLQMSGGLMVTGTPRGPGA